MPSIRIGLTTDFNLVGEQVGIGTTNPTATLEVAGKIRANNTSASSGVSTFTEYTGFLQPVQLISNTVSIAETTKGNLNSLSDEIKISGEVTIEPDVSVTGGRLDSLTTTDRFAVPLGETNNRDNAPEAGTTRFNQDFGTLEFFDGVSWKTVNSYSRGGAAGRGAFAGMENPARATVDYIQISTLGNAKDFGDLTDDGTQRERGMGCSSATRGFSIGGRTPTVKDIIDYATLASAGNSIDFGNLNVGQWYGAACSSSTRGISAGGRAPGSASNVMQYIEMGTLGNALDFGDLSTGRERLGALSSTTKGIWGGGYDNGSTNPPLSTIDSVTIASKGNAVRFGELDNESDALSACSNNTTGLWVGGTGKTAGSWDVIRSMSLTSGGLTQYFGDLVGTGFNNPGSLASQTRGVFAGGGNPTVNTISYVQISTSGNSQDFGDLTVERRFAVGWSDSHGGLGGF
jgi:hypothetical protein